jgi:hypothetical protein
VTSGEVYCYAIMIHFNTAFMFLGL